MNEQVQKIIKASFCPKEKWIKDDTAPTCFKCDKKFHPLYRRKHHCRYCGQIFCAACSDFSLSGQDLGLPDKQIRMCEACIQKCWKYIAKHNEQYITHRKSGDLDSGNELPANIQTIQQQTKSASSFSEEDRLKEIMSIIEEYTGPQVNGIKKLEKEINTRFVVLLQIILKQAKIPLKYLPEISEKAQEIVSRMPANFVITGNMNICQNIRIKGFWGEKFELSLEPVVLIKKVFTSKKIKDEYSKQTCILVYGNIESEDLVGGDKEASFQNMINYRLKEMNKIISYCQRVHISMIFLEGNIEKQFEDMLLSNEITVIPKVKVEYLSRLKVSLRIEKIVDAIGKVYEYPQKQITGFVKKMTSTTFTSAKEGHLIKKFFKIHTTRDELGLTLVIQDPSQKLLQNLKKEFKFILQTLTHMKLKVHKVKMDHDLLQSMPENMRKSCFLNNSEMFFSFYAEFHHDILSYIKEKYVTYKQITYVESDFGNYPEVSKGVLEEYIKGRTKSFRNKWLNFTEICNEDNNCHKLFYSEQDLPLGSYLLKKLTGLDKKCLTCGRPNYLHADVYYSTDQYMRVWAESMIVDEGESEINCYSSFTSQDESIRNGEMEMIFTYLEKHTTSNEKLKCFIQCLDCQQPISARQNVYKADLQFSILSFLHQMFKGSTETIIRENKFKKNLKLKTSTCQHIKKVRVYELGSKSVKFFVGKYALSRQCIMTPTGRQQFLKHQEEKTVVGLCLLEASKIDRIMQHLFEEIKSIAELSKNSKFDTIIKNPRSSFIKARHSIVGNPNVRLSQAQCIDIIIPELVEEVSKVNNIAQMMLNPKRITSFLESQKTSFMFMTLLRRCYIIINEVKKSVKKRQLQQKYMAKDFDNDMLMEDIDINQFVNQNSTVQNDSECTSSEISRSQLYSNYQTLDTSNPDEIADYCWLQPYSGKEEKYNRNDRRTESNILTKKASRMTDEEVYKVFKTVSSALKFDHGYIDFIPCFINKPPSLIVAALNSKQHKECIQDCVQFANELTIKITKYLQSELLIVENEEIKKLASLIDVQEKKFDIGNKIKKDTSGPTLTVTVLSPNQFQILRRKNKIPIDLFISSIAGAESWLATGGKSGSPFMRSYNDLLVIKKIPKGEFLTFRKSLSKYFIHLHEGSILTPIYGAFIIERGMSTEYYIVMENLFFGMKDWYLYDFKGSVTRRFSRPPVIPLDVNFLIDRFSEPIFCKDNILKDLSSTLDYLCDNNVIDYSLILVVQIQNHDEFYLDGNRFQIGIVDYMREYGAGEYIQNMWKGPDATVVEPLIYKNRMLKNTNRYFSQIPI